MELEIGDLEISQKLPKRNLSIQSLRFWIWCIRESDREYVQRLNLDFWEVVEKIKERRKRQVTRIHQLRIGWAYRILHELEIQLQVNDYYWPGIANLLDDKRREIDRPCVISKKAYGERQFARLFRKIVKQWKTRRDRELHLVASQEAKIIREATNRYLRDRGTDTDGQLCLAHRQMTVPKNYQDIAWLGRDMDKIDMMSLDGKCLEELCFAP